MKEKIEEFLEFVEGVIVLIRAHMAVTLQIRIALRQKKRAYLRNALKEANGGLKKLGCNRMSMETLIWLYANIFFMGPEGEAIKKLVKGKKPKCPYAPNIE